LIIRFKKAAVCGGMIEIPPTDSKGLGRKRGVNGILTFEKKINLNSKNQEPETKFLILETSFTFV